MKFLSFGVKNFGCFDDFFLTFDPEKTIQIIYGPNEAGKSTLLTALTDGLYGIHPQSRYGYRVQYQDMRIIAELVKGDKQLAFRRRKGNTATVLDFAEKPMEDAVLARFLDNVDRAQFEQTFGLDHYRLREGGRRLVETTGGTDESIFEAATGLAPVTKALRALGEEADSFFGGKKRKTVLRETAAQWVALNKAIAEGSLSAAVWKQKRAVLAAKQEEVAALEAHSLELNETKVQLHRLRVAAPLLAKYRDRKRENDALGELAVLPENCTQKRQAAAESKKQAELHIGTIRERLDQLDKKLKSLSVDEKLCREAAAVERLVRQLSQVDDSEEKVKIITGQLEQVKMGIASRGQQLFPELSSDELRNRQITKHRAKQVKERVAQVEQAKNRFRQLAADWENHENVLWDVRTAQEQRRRPQNLLPLKTAAKTCQALGSVDQDIQSRRSELESSRDEQERHLKALGLWQGTAQELAELPLPDQESVRCFQGPLAEMGQRLKQLAADLELLAQELAEAKKNIADLERQGVRVTPADLKNARKRRDQGWSIIAAVLTDEAIDPILQRAYARGDNLAAVFSSDLRNADQQADLLLDAAGATAEKAHKILAAEEIQRKLDKKREQQVAVQTEAQKLQLSWEQRWQPAEIQPLSPPEMLPWLQRAETIIKTQAAQEQKRRELDALQQRQESSMTLLRRALADLDQDPGVDRSWSQLLVHAETVFETLEKQNRAYEDGAKELDRLEKEGTEICRDQDACRQQEAAAEEAWINLRSELQWPPEVSWSSALSYLEDIEALGQAIDKHDQLRAERERHRKVMTEFNNETVGLCSRLGRTAAEISPAAVVEQLAGQLKAAQSAAVQKTQWEEQIDGLRDKLEEANVRRSEATRELEALKAEAGCDSLQDLEVLEKQHETKTRLVREMQDLRDQLLAQGHGLSFEALQAENAEVDADAIPGQIMHCEADLAAQTAKLREAVEAAGSLKNEVETLESSDSQFVIQKSQEREVVRSELEEQTRQYLRLRTAANLLQGAVERYLERNQTPLLQKGGKFFSQLTGGSFQGLQVNFDDKDQPQLFGIRRGEKEKLTIKGMSDGTQDQLYLALRLAYIEILAERDVLLPFVVDDILVHFDDERSSAALAALEKLSGKTQVIFFTHHQHLVDLALKCCGRAAAVHRLP